MRNRAKPPMGCRDCGMHETLCVCAYLHRIATATSVTVIIPWMEYIKTSNTGRLAPLLLEHARFMVRGEKDRPFSALDVLSPGRRNLVLYPGGTPLTPQFVASLEEPVNLIVPDGTWESAWKVIRREPLLVSLDRVSLLPGEPSAYRLRRTPVDGRLSTIEAIARALEALEALEACEVRSHIEQGLRRKVDRMLWAQGKIRTTEVEDGIPFAARVRKRGSLFRRTHES